jgi:hypothetical protein
VFLFILYSGFVRESTRGSSGTLEAFCQATTIVWAGYNILDALSRNSLRIHDGDRSMTLDYSQSLEILSAVAIDLGEVAVRAWRTTLSHQEL